MPLGTLSAMRPCKCGASRCSHSRDADAQTRSVASHASASGAHPVHIDDGELWRMFGSPVAGFGRDVKYQCRVCGSVVADRERADHAPTHRPTGSSQHRRPRISEHERLVRCLTRKRRKKRGNGSTLKVVGAGQTRKVGSHRDNRGHN